MYETWDLDTPLIPPRSRLYHIEPIGIGTLYVESLTSYIARLAEGHHITVRKLFVHEISPFLKSSYSSSLQHNGNAVSGIWQKMAGLNGLNASTKDWLQAIERLTCSGDLRFLTMLTWATVLSPKGLIRRQKVWCPLCYEEWQRNHQTIYEPLLWSLEVVTCCVKHRCRLCLECPKLECKRSVTLLSSNGRPGYCAYCGEWLGSRLVPECEDSEHVTEKELQWQQWVSECVGGMFSAAPKLLHMPNREILASAIKRCVEQKMNGKTATLARQLRLYLGTLIEWQQGSQVPQLSSLLRFSCALKVSPLSLLIGEDESNFPTAIEFSCDLPLGYKSRKHSNVINRSNLQYELEAELDRSDGNVSSLTSIATRFGYSISTISRHYPELSHEISVRYKNHQEAINNEKRQNLLNSVREAMYHLHAQGVYPRLYLMGKLLGKQSVSLIPAVREEWQNVLQELGLENKTQHVLGANQSKNDGRQLQEDAPVQKKHLMHEKALLLNPIGIGTQNIESLTSYITRLAEAYSVTTKDFILNSLLPLSEKLFLLSYDGSYILSLFWQKASRLNGNNLAIKDWLNVLETLTSCQDLRFLTMMAWNNVLEQSKLVRRTRAWCPLCYEEWRRGGQVIYEPLLWSLEVIRTCSHHWIPLSIQCPQCQGTLPFLAPLARSGYCSNCGCWLGVLSKHELGTVNDVGQDELLWQKWVINAIGELLANAPFFKKELQISEVVAKMTDYTNRLTGGNVYEMACKVGVSEDILYYWRRGKLIRLENLMRFCYGIGISPYHFLTAETIFSDSFQDTKTETRHKQRLLSEYDKARLRQELEFELKNHTNPPPPLKQLARRMGYHPSTLQMHFPELCNAITERYNAFAVSRTIF